MPVESYNKPDVYRFNLADAKFDDKWKNFLNQ